MSAVLLPGGAVPARSAVPQARSRRKGPRLAACVLAFVMLLEGVAILRPDLLLLQRWQAQPLFRHLSGYCMLALMLFGLVFGFLRRQPAWSARLRQLGELHQFAGLLLLVLLAFHVGQQPAGFLRAEWHALCIAGAAGALRTCAGARLGPRGSAGLLVLHIAGSCFAAATALVHVWLVCCYTA